MDITVTISEIPNGFSHHRQGMHFLKEGNCYNLQSHPFYGGSLPLICVTNKIFMHILKNKISWDDTSLSSFRCYIGAILAM